MKSVSLICTLAIVFIATATAGKLSAADEDKLFDDYLVSAIGLISTKCSSNCKI